MISRLTACAALFAILATATLAYAAESQQHRAAVRPDAAAAEPMPVIQLPAVTVIGHRVR